MFGKRLKTKPFDLRTHECCHLFRHPRINTHPESIPHDSVGVGQITDDPVAGVLSPHFIETRMLDEVSGKEHPGLNAFGFQMVDDIFPRETGIFPHGQ
jgi:hypothetical protein